jgi:hypothetical protein
VPLRLLAMVTGAVMTLSLFAGKQEGEGGRQGTKSTVAVKPERVWDPSAVNCTSRELVDDVTTFFPSGSVVPLSAAMAGTTLVNSVYKRTKSKFSSVLKEVKLICGHSPEPAGARKNQEQF